MSEKTIELYPLPENWTWTRISELGKVVSGGTPSTRRPEYWGGDIAWITPADLSGYKDKFIERGAKSITQVGLENSSARLMPAGSIHFSSRAPIGYVVISKNPISTNQGFKSLVPTEGVFNEYIYYYLKSAKQLAEKFASGTTFKEISGKAFANLPVPLPPLDEQRRIVTKIEELFSQLDAGVAALEQARAQLKRYRQTLLKAAFQGRLTADWRQDHAGELESADALLARIRAEREQRWQEQLAAWEEEVQAWEAAGRPGKKPRKPRKPKELPPLTEEELAELPELPEDWAWVRVGDITINHDGKRIPLSREYRKNFQGNYPYYGAVEIIDYVADYIFDGKFILIGEDGANLFSRSKPLAFVVEGKFWVNNHAHVLEAVEIDEDFFAYQFSSLNLHKYITGTAQPKLTQANLQKIPIAVCSKQEQLEISSILARNLSTIDHLDQTIEQALARAGALRQAILKRAFAGRLVPQDPEDEPASVLLARLRAEQQKAAKEKKPAQRKRKKKEVEMPNLETVLKASQDWISAQAAFRKCGVSDGATTDQVEALYMELRELVIAKKVLVERRGEEDWLKYQEGQGV